MSQSNFERTVERRLAEHEDKLRQLALKPAPAQPFQILADGRPFFQSGLVLGGGSFNEVYEPFEIPAPEALALTTGSSFDTIYIDASWEAPVDAPGSSAIASYTVQWLRDGEAVASETSTTGTTIRIEPLEPNTEYTVTVFGLSKNNRPGFALSGTITTGGDGTVPAVPTFPAAPVLPGVKALHIRWNSNTERDVANGAGQYRVVVSPNADLSSPVSNTLQAGTSAYIADLVAGTGYYVGVAARDSSGNESALAKPSGGPWVPVPIASADLAFDIGGGNILLNSGFENLGYDPWVLGGSGGAFDKVTDVYRGSFGIRSLKFSGTGLIAAWQDRTVYKGKYVLSAWVKATSIARPSGSAGTGPVLRWGVQSGTIVLSKILKGTAFGNYPTAGLGTYEWVRLAVVVEVTSNTAVLRTFVERSTNGTVTGTCWFDEVQVESGDTLTAYAPRPDEINAGTITSTQIADDAITTPKIAANSIVAGKIAAEAIGTNQLAANSIVASKIAAGQITGTHIAADTITASNITANAVTADKIQANSVTTAKLAADAVTADKLAAVAIAVGKFIQSSNYVSATTGWRIDGAGNAELNAATIRGSAFVGGSINIANRILASPADPTVHLAANVEIGANYSGTVYSGDTLWGFQIGNNFVNRRWTHTRGYLQPGENNEIAWFDSWRNRAVLYADTAGSVIKPGPDGVFVVGKVDQHGDWGTKGLIIRNGWATNGLQNRDHAGMAFHVEAWNLASILQVVGPNGPAIEARSADNSGWVPIKASAFLVNSQESGKRNIASLANKGGVSALRPVRYQRYASKPSGGRSMRSDAQKAYEDSYFSGFIVEEVAETHPHLVGWSQGESGPVPDSLDPMGILAEAVASIQSLETRLKLVESR